MGSYLLHCSWKKPYLKWHVLLHIRPIEGIRQYFWQTEVASLLLDAKLGNLASTSQHLSGVQVPRTTHAF